MRTNTLIAQIGIKAEALIGFNRVLPEILQCVSLELVDQTDPTPFLACPVTVTL